MKYWKSIEFYIVIGIIIITILAAVGSYFRWLELGFTIGPFRATHWLVWIGSFYIAVFTPLFYWLRRRYPKKNSKLVRIHVLSHLVSFLLISVHFSQQIGRPEQFFPEGRTGLALYIITAILVVTGVLHRLKILEKGRIYPPHRNRFVHVSLTLTFYILLIIHALHNLGYI